MFSRTPSDSGSVPASSREVAVRFDPPPGVSAALAGLLNDGRGGLREVSAMLVDLSTRGWFTMTREDGRWALMSAERLPAAWSLDAAEARLLDVLFVPGPAQGSRTPARQFVSMTTLTHRLQGHVNEIAGVLGDEAVSRGWASRNPVVGGGVKTWGRSPWTPLGEETRRQVQGFAQYLRTAEFAQLAQGEGEGTAGPYLGYAVALDLASQWASTLQAHTGRGSGTAVATRPDGAGQMLQILRENLLVAGAAMGLLSGGGAPSLEDVYILAVARNCGAKLPCRP